MSGKTKFESTRRRLTQQQAETVDRLTAAAITVLRDKGFADLTVRMVAAEAGVAAATAYTYFSSKSHLVQNCSGADSTRYRTSPPPRRNEKRRSARSFEASHSSFPTNRSWPRP